MNDTGLVVLFSVKFHDLKHLFSSSTHHFLSIVTMGATFDVSHGK